MCKKISVSLLNEAKKLLHHKDDKPQHKPVIFECSEDNPEHIFYVAGCDWQIEQHEKLVVIFAYGDHGPLRAEGKTLRNAFRDMRLEAELNGAKYALRDLEERNL
jgi:esterase/lipase superfamily enzyme